MFHQAHKIHLVLVRDLPLLQDRTIILQRYPRSALSFEILLVVSRVLYCVLLWRCPSLYQVSVSWVNFHHSSSLQYQCSHSSVMKSSDSSQSSSHSSQPVNSLSSTLNAFSAFAPVASRVDILLRQQHPLSQIQCPDVEAVPQSPPGSDLSFSSFLHAVTVLAVSNCSDSRVSQQTVVELDLCQLSLHEHGTVMQNPGSHRR